ncbi:MAG: tRNA (N6-isopentenyl adenosine(37)-C2)-methylthiotransferase MiaB [Firmicutes bacterium]|nr:tRNA (N6-isopentenyl adenosine(37)-C2)-methylthiotransferase MiaB [Bacillota bacterium]MDH7495095.1 tRNA (N6-isopentenyl adenosine(37)-C2)-methylthiotransferase MiaB [Bacillota bacterium]
MRKYFICTLGCQMNEHDSEVIAGILEGRGYIAADALEEADVIIFNTCCVRENPERKVYGRIADLKRLKRANPDLIIGVCGCMVQQEGEPQRIAEKLPHVDLVFGTMNIHRLPELLDRVEAGRKAVEVWGGEGGIVERLPIRRADAVSAWVTIMYGCDNYCSYCIVPYVRGRERSRRFEDIVREVRGLGNSGFREVVLLGQNVNSYGRDLADGHDFADLLNALDGTPGIYRIRYTTSHPRDFSQKLIDTIAAARTVCEHFHLPLQAGSDKVLARMNRGYTQAHYLDLVRRIREAVPGASITTDLIVGFPGETEEDFLETLKVVREVRFDSAFTFVFSPRRGTAAARMADQVPENVKSERIQRLIAVQEAITAEINEGLRGRVVEILVEGESKTNPSMLAGRTRTNKLVVFPRDDRVRRGDLVKVKITKPQAWTQMGEVVEV